MNKNLLNKWKMERGDDAVMMDDRLLCLFLRSKIILSGLKFPLLSPFSLFFQ